MHSIHTHTHTHARARMQISLSQNKIWNTEFFLKLATYQLHNQCLQTLVRSFSYCIESLRLLNATRYSKMTHSQDMMTPRCLAQKGLPYFKENVTYDKCIMLIANLSESNKLLWSKYPPPSPKENRPSVIVIQGMMLLDFYLRGCDP